MTQVISSQDPLGLGEGWVVVPSKGLVDFFNKSCDELFSVFARMELDNAVDCQYDLDSVESVFNLKYADCFGKMPPKGLFFSELSKRCKQPARREENEDYY